MHDQQHDQPAIDAPTPPEKSKGSRSSKSELLSIRNDEGMFRVRLTGGDLRALDFKQLRAQIARLHTPGNPPAVLFSMRGTETLSSGCIGTFAQLSTDLERVGGVLVLYNLPKEIIKVLKKTKLDRLIHTAKSRPQARKRARSAQRKLAQSNSMRAA